MNKYEIVYRQYIHCSGELAYEETFDFETKEAAEKWLKEKKFRDNTMYDIENEDCYVCNNWEGTCFVLFCFTIGEKKNNG